MNGINKMTEMILSEARADRDARIAKANAEAEAIRAEYDRQGKALIAAQAEKTRQEVNALIERARSDARMEERNLRLETWSALLDEAYANGLESICGDKAAGESAYLALLGQIFDTVLADQLAAEANSAANDPYGEYTPIEQYGLRMNERDIKTLGGLFADACKAKLAAAGKTLASEVGTAPIKGGFILVCGEVELNCSIEGYMDRIRSVTENEVHKILFG